MNEVSKKMEQIFFVVAPPVNYQFDPENLLDLSLPGYSEEDKIIKRYYPDELSDILKPYNIFFVDFMDIFIKNKSMLPYPLNGENHMTPNGAFLAAKETSNFIINNF